MVWRHPDTGQACCNRYDAPHNGLAHCSICRENSRPISSSESDGSVAEQRAGDSDAPITIKKYANRRLYNTATSSYVTLEHLAEMVRECQDFIVYDAKTGDDITRSVLTQIIFEAESKGAHLLPTGFLRRLIRIYGDSLQTVVPGYLEMSMDAFVRNQDEMRENVEKALGEPYKQFEELGRRNMDAFQQAMRMFNPFTAAAEPDTKPAPPPGSKSAPDTGVEIAELKSKLDEMQRQLDAMLDKQS